LAPTEDSGEHIGNEFVPLADTYSSQLQISLSLSLSFSFSMYTTYMYMYRHRSLHLAAMLVHQGREIL